MQTRPSRSWVIRGCSYWGSWGRAQRLVGSWRHGDISRHRTLLRLTKVAHEDDEQSNTNKALLAYFYDAQKDDSSSKFTAEIIVSGNPIGLVVTWAVAKAQGNEVAGYRNANNTPSVLILLAVNESHVEPRNDDSSGCSSESEAVVNSDEESVNFEKVYSPNDGAPAPPAPTSALLPPLPMADDESSPHEPARKRAATQQPSAPSPEPAAPKVPTAPTQEEALGASPAARAPALAFQDDA
jgi:hypothetical protein